MIWATTCIVALALLVGACSSRVRLSIEPCLTIRQAERLSDGLDIEPANQELGEESSRLGVWQVVELRDGADPLITIRSAKVNLSTYRGSVGEIAVMPVGDEAFFPLAETRARLGPVVERVLGAGFVRVQGDVDQFLLSVPGGPLLRMLVLRRDDYELALVLEVTESQAEATVSYYATSAARCRSPEMLKWLAEHKLPPPEDLDVVWPGDKKPTPAVPRPARD